jgi:hypothetical protein
VSSNQDQARLIAERVARRLAGESAPTDTTPSRIESANGANHRRARIVNFVAAGPPPRTTSSIGTERETGTASMEAPLDLYSETAPSSQTQVAQSPWLAPFASSFGNHSLPQTLHSALHTPDLANHPSQERFGVDEAAVSELVEFFEAEKQCSVDPSGKPCDHCAMCSSRGF